MIESACTVVIYIAEWQNNNNNNNNGPEQAKYFDHGNLIAGALGHSLSPFHRTQLNKSILNISDI